MGKILKILGVVFIILVVGVAALLYWAHGEGKEQQQRFFDAVASGDPANVLGMMGPDLKAEIDPPVLKMWMDAVNVRLGRYKGLSAGDFHTETESTDAGRMTETKGTAEFEKGTAQVRLTLLGDTVVGFAIESDQVKPSDWSRKPEGDFYQKKARMLVEHLVAGRIDQAMAMMHPNLAAQLEPEKVAAGMKRFVELYGALEGIEVVDEAFRDGNDPSLRVQMLCKCSKQTVKAHVEFVFNGMRGHLTAFELPED